MKKLSAVLFAIICAASIASAKEGAMSYGPKFALNFATESGDNSSYINSSTKFGIGGFVTYGLADPFALQGEVLYNRKGCSIPPPGADPTVTVTGSYLDFVALAKYVIPLEGDIKPSVFVGPSLGILLSASTDQGSTTTDVTKDVSGADFALVFGAGAAHKMGNGSVVFDLRYYLGLSNVHKNSPPSNSNQIFSITVGYAFM
jgi:hypothetical protein